MKKSKTTEKILAGLDNLITATEIIFSRDSLWSKLQRLGSAPSRREFLTSFYSLQRSGLWYVTKLGKYQLTEKGRLKLGCLNIRSLVKNQKWDGWWRLVIFDISEDKKKFREALRWKLNKFGFYPLQKSIFVFPYDCQKEIVALVNFFEGNENIEYIVAKSLGGKEDEVRRFFNL